MLESGSCCVPCCWAFFRWEPAVWKRCRGKAVSSAAGGTRPLTWPAGIFPALLQLLTLFLHPPSCCLQVTAQGPAGRFLLPAFFSPLWAPGWARGKEEHRFGSKIRVIPPIPLRGSGLELGAWQPPSACLFDHPNICPEAELSLFNFDQTN